MNRSAGNMPRVALMSVTMGLAQRGYERLFRDLYELLRTELDITLIKGAGEPNGTTEYVPRLFPRAQQGARRLPFGRVAGSEYSEYKADCLAFALALVPQLTSDRFDVVHLIDFPLGHMLRRLKPLLRGRPKLLMTNGCRMQPEHYPALDYIHEIAEPDFASALQGGVPADRLRFAPIGIHADRFARHQTREDLRRQYGVPPETFVILSVAALKRVHKRIDHLIHEASLLHGDFVLWLDGNPEDADLVQEARVLLGAKCKITLVPSLDVGDLYHLADVMVHSALEEAFGLSIVEGLSTGLPVLTHHSAHFRWLTGTSEGLVDMAHQGHLAERLQGMIDAPRTAIKDSSKGAAVRERFDWKALKPAYVEMYQGLMT